MNRSFIHLLLIFCLLLAQPLQGLAKAAGASVCHGAGGNEAGQMLAVADDATALTDAMAHQHEHDDPSHPHQPTPAKSGHGAPCCIGAALLAGSVSFPVNPGTSPIFVLPGQMLPSVWLPGPERPPRTSLI